MQAKQYKQDDIIITYAFQLTRWLDSSQNIIKMNQSWSESLRLINNIYCDHIRRKVFGDLSYLAMYYKIYSRR